MSKKIFQIIIVLILCLSCSDTKKTKKITLEGHVFGTTYKIVYLNALKNHQKSIDSLFYLMNKSLSTYMPTSDISKINKGDTTVVLDHLFLEVFKKSKKIYAETDGYFDPTVGDLVNAWGFGPENQKNDLTEKQVQEQMKYVGLDKVKIVKKRIQKEFSEIYLDFNSIAKGFGIDLVARFFEDKKIKNYLIEIGGEIRAKGTKENGVSWAIKLVNPILKDNLDTYIDINLSNKSMATSGNYRKFRVSKKGQKFVHTINPKTGHAIESDLLSASVIANLDCADVDAYATALMAMGLEKAKHFLKNHSKIDAILFYVDKDGNLKEYKTGNYASLGRK